MVSSSTTSSLIFEIAGGGCTGNRNSMKITPIYKPGFFPEMEIPPKKITNINVENIEFVFFSLKYYWVMSGWSAGL